MTPRGRLLWNGRDRRREAEPVPAQVLEIVRPQREQVVSGSFGTAQEQQAVLLSLPHHVTQQCMLFASCWAASLS